MASRRYPAFFVGNNNGPGGRWFPRLGVGAKVLLPLDVELCLNSAARDVRVLNPHCNPSSLHSGYSSNGWCQFGTCCHSFHVDSDNSKAGAMPYCSLKWKSWSWRKMCWLLVGGEARRRDGAQPRFAVAGDARRHRSSTCTRMTMIDGPATV